eukprot:s645_g15.t1
MVDVVTARSVQSWSCFLRFDSPGQDSYIPSTFEVGAWIRELNLGLLCVVSSTTLWVERGPACFSSSRQILNSGSSWPSLLLVQKMRASHIDKPASGSSAEHVFYRIWSRETWSANTGGMVAQLESAIKTVHDHTFSCQKELQFMVADNRAAQKHATGLQLVTTGWPNGLTPQQREYMLGWMLGNTPEIVSYLQARGLLAQNYEHTALSPNGYASFWFNVLSTDPVTVPQKAGFYSGMTLLSFKSWDLRSAFLRRYGGTSGMPLYIDQNTPQPNKHVRSSPFTPQWQRKLETPLRVLIAACNAHPETQGKRLIILWKTLTLMMPTDERDFKHHTAWARLFYEEKGRTFKGRLEVVQEFAAILNGPPVEKDGGEEILWAEKWNQTVWGNQLELDDMEPDVGHIGLGVGTKAFNDALRSILDHTAPTGPRRKLSAHAPDTAQRTHITFYTDGSGSNGRCAAATPAGWGWCAPQGADWLEAYGPVVASSDHTAYVGATVGSNNTGEVTAIVEALLLAVEHEYTHATVHTDSLWARNVILGKWKARTNKALVQTARRLLRRMGVRVHIEWIKAHAGHVGNEKADKLAKLGRTTAISAKRAEAAQEDDAKYKRNVAKRSREALYPLLGDEPLFTLAELSDAMAQLKKR